MASSGTYRFIKSTKAELAEDSQGGRLTGSAFGQQLPHGSKRTSLAWPVFFEMGVSLSSPSWLQTCNPLVCHLSVGTRGICAQFPFFDFTLAVIKNFISGMHM